MNNERVQRLYDRLKGLADDRARAERFRLDVWHNNRDLDAHDVKPEAECGFAGCVVGWAGHEHWFDDLGLRIELNPGGKLGQLVMSIKDGDLWVNRSFQREHVTVARFLDVDPGAVAAIIYPDHYDISPVPLHEVLERVEMLLKGGEEPLVELGERCHAYNEDNPDDENNEED